jgi:hypothetical protein
VKEKQKIHFFLWIGFKKCSDLMEAVEILLKANRQDDDDDDDDDDD